MRLFSIIILTFIWGLVSYFLDKDILPSPIIVAESIKYHSSQELFFHISVTLFRVVTSFFLAMLIGSVIGIAMGRKKILDETEEILRERFHGNIRYSVIHHIEEDMENKLTAQSNLINNYSKNELCRKFNWDINKPIVIIFATDLTDGVFKVDWKIFKDFLTGLQETLNIIKEINAFTSFRRDGQFSVRDHNRNSK